MIPQSIYFLEIYYMNKEYNIKLNLSSTDIEFIMNAISMYNDHKHNYYDNRVSNIKSKFKNAMKDADEPEIKKLYNSFVNKKEYK